MSVVLLGLSLVLSAGAPADDAAPASAPQKKICKAEAATGTRLSRRKVCRTAAEWEFLRKQAVEESRELQDNTQNRYNGN